jgi:hypothetical protein
LKLPEENTGETLQNISIGNDFLNRISRAQEIRARIDTWDCIKLKSLCTAQETVNRVKRQPTE